MIYDPINIAPQLNFMRVYSNPDIFNKYTQMVQTNVDTQSISKKIYYATLDPKQKLTLIEEIPNKKYRITIFGKRDIISNYRDSNNSYNFKLELVIEKEYFTINSIPEYKITLEKEYIEFDVKNIDSLILNNHIKYLVCQKCNIKELQLNPKLELLDAYQNEITRIELSENLIEVDLRSNPLEYIKINKNLNIFYTFLLFSCKYFFN